MTQAPLDIVDRVKAALMEKRAPINVIYNHHGYWHSVIVLGFNDEIYNSCYFVRAQPGSLRRKARSFKKLARKTTNPERKAYYQEKAAANKKFATDIEEVTAKRGCRKRGVFFVRDSIYADRKEPYYDYDLKRRGEESRYSARIIKREYEWLEYLSNHVIQIYL